jgi:hypothetical protein
MLIPLRHENREGRRWRVQVRAHILLPAAAHPEVTMYPNIAERVTKFKTDDPGIWNEAQSQNRDVADDWDARMGLTEDPGALQEEMNSLTGTVGRFAEKRLLDHYAFVLAHPSAIS